MRGYSLRLELQIPFSDHRKQCPQCFHQGTLKIDSAHMWVHSRYLFQGIPVDSLLLQHLHMQKRYRSDHCLFRIRHEKKFYIFLPSLSLCCIDRIVEKYFILSRVEPSQSPKPQKKKRNHFLTGYCSFSCSSAARLRHCRGFSSACSCSGLEVSMKSMRATPVRSEI